MVGKVAVLVLLSAFLAVPCSSLNPPYRSFMGGGVVAKDPITGSARLDVQDERITNITTTFWGNWTNDNVIIDVLVGGVGYNYVTFFYQVPANSTGAFTTYIFTDQSSDVHEISQQKPATLADPPRALIYFMYTAEHNASNSSKTDVVSFSFDDNDFISCGGSSVWANGNGSRAVGGGYPENFLDVVLHVPEGVSGSSEYGCYYFYGDLNFGRARLFPDLQQTVGDIGLVQFYYTFNYIAVPINRTQTFNGYEILSYEGTIDWKNGTCQWKVVDGGAGFDYLTIEYQQAAYAYGIMDFNLMVNLSSDPFGGVRGPEVSFVKEE